MNTVNIIFLAMFFTLSLCRDDANEVASSKSKFLDSNLRKALLKALMELENEGGGDTKSDSGVNNVVEKAPASAFSVYQREATEKSEENLTEAPKKKQIVVIQRSSGLQHKPITSFIPSNITEHFVASATGGFRNIPRSRIVNQNFTSNNLTSPSPTVETPTTEENEAKVEDVQFFSAPLVAAFTVHQDERGLPKSVEPIYKQTTQVPTVNNLVNDQKFNTQQEIFKQERLKTEQLRNQFALQEKQRILEEEVYKLQRQQKEQQDFLFRQQQLIQEQQRKLLEERVKNRIKQNDQAFVPTLRNQFNQNEIDTSNSFRRPSDQENLGPFPSQIESVNGDGQNANSLGTQLDQRDPLKSIVFQPSVSLSAADHLNKMNELPLNAQQLPTIKINDFRRSPYASFDQVQSVLVPPHQTTFHSANYVQNIDVPQTQNIRTYRREPTTGNYLNNAYNHNKPAVYSIQPSIPVNIRPLRSNAESYQTSPTFHQPLINQQLSNLLYNSGISNGRQEDFDIVSKVLSYNHLGGGNNFLSGSRFYTPIHRSDEKV